MTMIRNGDAIALLRDAFVAGFEAGHGDLWGPIGVKYESAEEALQGEFSKYLEAFFEKLEKANDKANGAKKEPTRLELIGGK